MYDIRVLKVEENSENRFHSCQNSARAGPTHGTPQPWRIWAAKPLPCGAGVAAQETGRHLSEPGSQGTNLAPLCGNLLKTEKRGGSSTDVGIFFSSL